MPFTVNAEAAECPIQLNSLVLQQELSDVQICVFEDQKVSACKKVFCVPLLLKLPYSGRILDRG